MRMYLFYLYTLFCCILFFTCYPSSGQDSTFTEKSASQLISLYSEAINAQSGLYNGREYIPVNFYVTGHPYFESDVVEDGVVDYDGVLYKDVPMIFDLLQDELIIEHYNGVYNVQLHKERIQYFTLLGHTFIRINQDSLQKTAIEAGFYDRLYNGAVKVLAKRTKVIQEAPGKTSKKFLQKNNYFIQKNGQFYPVKSKRSVIQVFSDQKKPLQKFLRDNQINFNADYEKAVIQLAAYYDTIYTQL